MKKQPSLFWTLFICALFFMALFTPSCTSDELPPPMVSAVCDTLVTSYDTNVKTIIDESCAYLACHSGSSQTGAPRDFRSYDGLLFYLNSGSFRTRVLNTEGSSPLAMPPSSSVYMQSEKDSLTSEERQILECWLDAGFPEN